MANNTIHIDNLIDLVVDNYGRQAWVDQPDAEAWLDHFYGTMAAAWTITYD